MKSSYFMLCIILIYAPYSTSQTTQDFTHQQEYLFDPSNTGVGPIGVGAWNVWSLPGAYGDNVKIVDVERSWNLNHEDLPPGIPLIYGNINPEHINHGTAVLGIMVGQNNGFGITGICPNATIYVSSHYDIEDPDSGYVAVAIHAAINILDAGDIIVLEAEKLRKKYYRVPAENVTDVREAIVEAVQQEGIIVIEAAGNGNLDIGDYVYGNSGAIMVGAGHPDALTRVPGTNCGDRIDLHAWGLDVVTTGKGNLYSGDPNTINDDYRNDFRGTSSATAIVAGIAASLQSIYWENTDPHQKLTPSQMRDVLKNSGLVCAPGEKIGYRPSLPDAINYLIDHYGLNLGNRFVKVPGDQKNVSNISFGSLDHYKLEQFIDHEAPHDFYFQESSEQVLRGLQEFKTGTTEKHNRWEIADIFEDVLNHKIFTIVSNQPTIKAAFDEAKNATIQTELISHGGIQGDFVDFMDPWFFEDGNPQYYDPPYGYRNLGMAAPFITYESPLNLITGSPFKGVFLDQGWPFWEPPYYSVRALPREIDDVTYFLEEWEAEGDAEFDDASSPTTAVVFREPNVSITARMKGHLATSTSGAVATNSQRKLIFDGTNYHLVYEDAGHIYYTESANGVDWTAEVKLSNDLFINKGASISVSLSEGTYETICVVWQHGPQINLRIRSISGEWGEVELLDLLNNGAYDATPVVDYGYDSYYYIVWRDAKNSQASEFDLKIRAFNWDTGNSGTKYQILETNDHSMNPSLISDSRGLVSLGLAGNWKNILFPI